MSSLINRFKASAGKAAFEADKLLRIQSAQSAIKPLRAEVDRLYLEMGKLAYLLYTQGQIPQPELRTAGERLTEAFAQISAAEAEVERIRAEEYVEPISNEISRSSLICPNGHGALAGGASFCQMCGAAGVQPAPPPTASATTTCQQCGSPLDPDTHFCTSCGAPVERCTSCGAVLLPDAMFCSACGASLAETSSQNAVDTSITWPDQIEQSPSDLGEE